MKNETDFTIRNIVTRFSQFASQNINIYILLFYRKLYLELEILSYLKRYSLLESIGTEKFPHLKIPSSMATMLSYFQEIIDSIKKFNKLL